MFSTKLNKMPGNSPSIDDLPNSGELTPISGQPQYMRELTTSSHQSSSEDSSRRNTDRPFIEVNELNNAEENKPSSFRDPS